MYSKTEKTLLRERFWIAFGRYMNNVPGADGNKTNWINYKTGVKYLYFRMEAGTSSASITLLLNSADLELQKQQYKVLLMHKNIFQQILKEEWDWRPHYLNEEQRVISSVIKILPSVSVLSESDWPSIISFLKPRIIALDLFWSEVRFAFECI